MQLLDYVTISLFTLGILIIGVSFSRSGKDVKNFFTAGGAVPWWINGLSLFMGFFSAGTFVVWGSIAYSYGIVAITIQMTMCIAGFLVSAIVAPKWHKTGVTTAAEYIRLRLGIKVQKMYTYLFLFISMFTTGSFLYPVAKIVEVSTGLPLESCILLLGGISILYVTVGGLWAVIVTDVLQFVILTAAVLIVVPLSIHRIGNVDNVIEQLPDNFLNIFNADYTVIFIIAFCLYNFFFLGGNWSYIQRYTTVKTSSDSRKVGMLFGCLYLLCPVLWMIPPMVYRIVNPDLSGLADEGAYLLMCKEVLTPGLLGLMLGGMIFATASSLNGTLNISASVFTNDIYKLLFPETKERSLMRIARFSTIGFGILAIIVALLIPFMGGIVNVVISVAALTGVPLYLPIIWTLFSKRQNAHTVMSCTLISLCINAFFKFITPALWDFSLTRQEEMLTGVGFPIIIMTIFEWMAYYKKYVDIHALALVHNHEGASLTPVDQSKAESDNSFSLRMIGIGIGTSGILILFLGLVANEINLWACFIAFVLLLLGIFIFYKSRRKGR